MATIFGETKFFDILVNYSAEISYESKISSKSLYLARFSRYKAFLCFAIFVKNSKIQNGHHFWRDKIFENWVYYSAEISYGSKILSKLLHLARFSKKNLKNFINGRHFWGEKFFFEN